MYQVKLIDRSDNNRILNLYYFEIFQNALSFALDTSCELYAPIPKERKDKLGRPFIIACSLAEPDKGMAYDDDFEVRYDDGLMVSIGTVFCSDEKVSGR